MEILENIPLNTLTTIGLGGAAKFYSACRTQDEMIESILYAKKNNLPFAILGGGSNVVVRDEGFSGLIIHLKTHGWEHQTDEELVVQGGTAWDEFVEYCVAKRLYGNECLSGIPGSVGATPIQNVGAYGQEISQICKSVTVYDCISEQIVNFGAADCDFAYRQSRFKSKDRGRYVVLEVRFQLSYEPGLIRYPELERALDHDAGNSAEDRRKKVLNLRRKKSMVVDSNDPESKSVGSFFMNPVLSAEDFKKCKDKLNRVARPGETLPVFEGTEGFKLSAAWIVEHCGFTKGYTVDGVGISKSHSLALVNRGGTTKSLLNLANLIQESALEKFGISLEREPIIL